LVIRDLGVEIMIAEKAADMIIEDGKT